MLGPPLVLRREHPVHQAKAIQPCGRFVSSPIGKTVEVFPHETLRRPLILEPQGVFEEVNVLLDEFVVIGVMLHNGPGLIFTRNTQREAFSDSPIGEEGTGKCSSSKYRIVPDASIQPSNDGQ